MHLDTSAVVRLYTGRPIPPGARARIDAEPLAVSPMVLLELGYLHEIGRATEPPDVVLGELRARIGLRVVDASFAEVARHALALSWTREPFDRLIVAAAAVEGANLLTSDRHIRAHFDRAVWD